MAQKPRMFIGSSGEALPIANAIQAALRRDAECTIWKDGVFGLSDNTLDSLVLAARQTEFAVLVATPDDLLTKRGKRGSAPRDNVIFELGLFVGAIGRSRTFLVHEDGLRLVLPTDLLGITLGTWDRRADGNHLAGVQPLAEQLRSAMKRAIAPVDELSLLRAELAAVKAEQRAQSEEFRGAFNALTARTSSPSDTARTEPKVTESGAALLEFMTGHWHNRTSGTHAYAKVTSGRLRMPYCYSGNNELTAEYYDFKLLDGSALAKFRWISKRKVLPQDDIRGYGYFRADPPRRMFGGWWFEEDVDPEVVRVLPDVDGMILAEWERIADGAAWPAWATDFHANPPAY